MPETKQVAKALQHRLPLSAHKLHFQFLAALQLLHLPATRLLLEQMQLGLRRDGFEPSQTDSNQSNLLVAIPVLQ